MMPRFWDANLHWWLSLGGWSVVVALWHTTIAALVLAIWRGAVPRASSTRQYAVAAALLLLAAAATAATPLALAAWPRHAPVPVSAAGALLPVAGLFAPPRLMPAVVTRPLPPGLDAGLMAWVGLAWFAGACAGVLRLGGGWVLARRLRRAARPISEPAILDCAEIACRPHRVSPALLASDRVDAPVVIGHRRPAILLPGGAAGQLGPDAIEPLLAHEIAHVVRRDYALNLLQSLADALLFFSPGARWISRCVREAREFCCDDAVVARCGTGSYVRSLTTLAALGVQGTRPALSAAGPRLIVRIRRLLREDTRTRFGTPRLAGIAGALVLAIAAGFGLVPVSGAAVAQAAGVTFTAPIEGPVPRGFIATQPGAAVALRDITASDAAYCGTATVENRGNVAATGLRFAAYAHARGPARSTLAVGGVQATALLDVDVAPGSTASVEVGLMSLDDLRQSLRTGSPQVMCAITEIRYANGAGWSNAPVTIFGPQHAEVSRMLMSGVATDGSPVCRDDRGLEYSDGAVVPIALEPGAFALCRQGTWAEIELPPMKPDPPAR